MIKEVLLGQKKNFTQHFIQIVTDFHQFSSCKVHLHNEHGMKQVQTLRRHDLIFSRKNKKTIDSC